MSKEKTDILVSQLWAAEVARRNSESLTPMTPEANFRRGAEAVLNTTGEAIKYLIQQLETQRAGTIEIMRKLTAELEALRNK